MVRSDRLDLCSFVSTIYSYSNHIVAWHIFAQCVSPCWWVIISIFSFNVPTLRTRQLKTLLICPTGTHSNSSHVSFRLQTCHCSSTAMTGFSSTMATGLSLVWFIFVVWIVGQHSKRRERLSCWWDQNMRAWSINENWELQADVAGKSARFKVCTLHAGVGRTKWCFVLYVATFQKVTT